MTTKSCGRQSCVKVGLTFSAVVFVIFLCIAPTADAAPAETQKLPTPAKVPGGSSSHQNTETVSTASGDEGICYTQGCNDTALTILRNMDPNVEPCDNFYKYACGGFIKSTIIPEDKPGVDMFTNVGDHMQEQVRRSIAADSKADERKPFRVAKNFYKSCMNQSAIEAKGLEPLREILRKLGGWPVLDGDSWVDGDFDWINSIHKFRDAGYSVNYFISFGTSVDLKNSTKHVIDVDQAALGLPRESLLNIFASNIVSAYNDYMVDVATILGADRDRAIEELKQSLIFEMKLANITLPDEKRHNMIQLYNPMTLVELTKNHPYVPWKEYISRLLPAAITIEEDEIINVKAPKYFTDLEKLMAETPKRTQANYVMWRVAQASAGYLNYDMRRSQFAFLKAITGRNIQPERWKECVDIVSRWLPLSVGAMYVRQYFNNDAKEKAAEMVMDLKDELTRVLINVPWMDEITRQNALKKVAAMSSHIAYPNELLNDDILEKIFENLELSDDDYLGNMQNLTLFGTDYNLSKLRKQPVNKTDWVIHGHPTVVNAFYNFNENSIELPAAILQGAFFSNYRPSYMNYGAIGFIIGHELTHGFDVQGRQFDGDGNLVNWWVKTTKESFLQRAKCIINQYANYTAEEVGLTLNGNTTQDENIADNGGIKIAYYAYKQWVKRNGPELKLPNIDRTPNQLFWISAANMWCTKYRPEAVEFQILQGVHSPEEFRVRVSLSNMEEFSKDFNCPIGSKMNPKNKCSVW